MGIWSLQALNVSKSISEPQDMFYWLGLMITLNQLFRSDEIGLWIVLGLCYRLNIWSKQAKLLLQALPRSQCALRGQCGCAPEVSIAGNLRGCVPKHLEVDVAETPIGQHGWTRGEQVDAHPRLPL